MGSGTDPTRDQMSPEVRWGVGCLVGAAAITGLLILLMYVAFTFEPPLWVQLVLAAGLTIGGGLLTWIVVTALGESKARSQDPAGVVEPFPTRSEPE
jgi:phosphate/sulfate permease